MSLSHVLYEHIKTTFTLDGAFRYGSAEGETGKYIVMFKIADPEEPLVLCDENGQEGQAIYQFSAYLGQELASDSLQTENYLQDFKDQFDALIGVIGTTEQYRIWYNRPSGVTVLGEGVNEKNIWGSVFDAVLRWTKI